MGQPLWREHLWGQFELEKCGRVWVGEEFSLFLSGRISSSSRCLYILHDPPEFDTPTHPLLTNCSSHRPPRWGWGSLSPGLSVFRMLLSVNKPQAWESEGVCRPVSGPPPRRVPTQPLLCVSQVVDASFALSHRPPLTSSGHLRLHSWWGGRTGRDFPGGLSLRSSTLAGWEAAGERTCSVGEMGPKG